MTNTMTTAKNTENVFAEAEQGNLVSKMRSIPMEEKEALKKEFEDKKFIRIPQVVSTELLKLLKDECDYLTNSYGKDKHLIMKSTGDTPRKMRTVGQETISTYGGIIPKIYVSEQLKELIASIAGEQVFHPLWKPEEYVISNLCQNGDTHGWHWDDYTYAFVIYVKSTDIEQGGLVQTCSGGFWNKENPQINQTMLNSVIRTHWCEAGD